MSYANYSSENSETRTDSGPSVGADEDQLGITYAVSQQHAAKYVLRLYVTGTTPQSARAISSIKAVCEKNLDGRYDLEVIDIYQQPELAKSEQIIAAPTLIKSLPLPLRKLIGNLSDIERVLVGLGLQPADESK